MSLETQIANLVAATNQLTGEVSGKMASINQTVDAKKAELDAWRQGVNNDYANYFSADIAVLGNSEKWYPVVIDLPVVAEGDIHIFRYIHTDNEKYGMSNGALRLHLCGMSGQWGGASASLFPMSYGYMGSWNYPVADFAITAWGMRVAIWLRGDRHYQVRTSYPAEVEAFSADVNNLILDNADPSLRVILDAKTAVSASMIPNNYIIGG